MKIVRLTFESGLHIGSDESGIGREAVREIVHSDTLFSMIVNAYAAVIGKDMPLFINSVRAISSGFLFERTHLRKFRYYLPFPMIEPADFSGDHGLENKLEYAKDLSECLYFEREIFAKWIRGRTLSQTYPMITKICSPSH